MKKLMAVVGMAALLFGCANTSGDAGSTAYRQGAAARPAPHAGHWAVAVIGTPFYLAFKTVACAGTIVVAAPIAAVSALADSPYILTVDELGDGVAANCGPPYVLSPS
jgi:hypothetical protein